MRLRHSHGIHLIGTDRHGWLFSSYSLCKTCHSRQYISSYLVLAIATLIVAAAAVSISLLHGDFRGIVLHDFVRPDALWSYAADVALTIAVASLFLALSLGQASNVVPIYGMFIVGGSVLGIVFLGELLTLRKILGVVLAAASILLITT